MEEYLKDIFIAFSVPSIIILLIVLCMCAFDYYASCQKARIYNNQHGTDYTCGEFFWAQDQIQQQTQTINIEGGAR